MDARDTLEGGGLRPVKIDKFGPLYSMGDVRRHVLRDIGIDDYFTRRNSKMTSDVQIAIAKTEKVTEEFSKALDKFFAVEASFVERSKKASGSVRDAADKMASGLYKIEKSADMARLQGYVELLERAATAMNALADLEKTGKLEKIANSLR